MGEDIQLVDESQILDVLDMYKLEKHLKLLVAVFDKDTCDQYDALVLEPLYVVPPEPSTIPSECFPPPAQEGQAAFESKVAGCEEPAGEEADEAEPDVFDSGEEYVGVDDEGMYGHPSAPTTGADTAQPGQPDVPAAGADTAQQEPPEVEINDADPQELHVLHDLDNQLLDCMHCFLTSLPSEKQLGIMLLREVLSLVV
jgi:hypothetical protein